MGISVYPDQTVLSRAALLNESTLFVQSLCYYSEEIFFVSLSKINRVISNHCPFSADQLQGTHHLLL